MRWDRYHYPSVMTALDEQVRTKAIELANSLLDEGYAQTEAVSLAMLQAQTWAESRVSMKHKRALHVVYQPNGWVVRGSGGKQAYNLFKDRETARKTAMEMGEEEGILVIFYDTLGQIEGYINFRQALDMKKQSLDFPKPNEGH